MEENKSKNGRTHCRVGVKFNDEVTHIQREMYKTKGFISSEKITNLIIKHTKYWLVIKKDIINASDEEIKNANE